MALCNWLVYQVTAFVASRSWFLCFAAVLFPTVHLHVTSGGQSNTVQFLLRLDAVRPLWKWCSHC